MIGRLLPLVLCIFGLVPATVAAFLSDQWSAVGRMSPLAASAATSTADADADAPSKPIHIAYAGNSMIYFHDTPRFFANLATRRRVASHDCCLRGGASLPSLFREGNGMRNKFRTLRESETDIGSPTVSAMLRVSPTYRKQVNNSIDLGSPAIFTMKTQEGFRSLCIGFG